MQLPRCWLVCENFPHTAPLKLVVSPKLVSVPGSRIIQMASKSKETSTRAKANFKQQEPRRASFEQGAVGSQVCSSGALSWSAPHDAHGVS